MKTSRIDVFVYIISKFINGSLIVANVAISAVLAVAISNEIKAVFPNLHPGNVTLLAILGWSIVFFVVMDLSNYISHFLQHFVPVLWELHKVHHSATFLNPLTGRRQHPLGDHFDNLVTATMVAVPLGICKATLGLSLEDMALMVGDGNLIGSTIVLDSLRHSQFPAGFGPLDRVLASPHMHQLHHSYKVEHWDRNFGNKLSIWDWWFGTQTQPAPYETFPWGLGKAEDHDYDTLWGVYVLPLVKIGRLIRGVPVYADAYSLALPKRPFFERVLWRKPDYGTRRAAPTEPPAAPLASPARASASASVANSASAS
ncbi:MAG TPA: sterol desaturase family protein [Caulobacteraceae bacterium]|nr:sterol desaturase family protein [Caulobacteraceae bacterium]